MKLEVGMYVRTKYGIERIKIIEENFSYGDCTFIATDNDEFRGAYNGHFNGFTTRNNVITKASYNIIDLIKPKDIILGKDGKIYQCWKVYKDYVFTYSKNKQGQTITLVDYQIDKVMCYEQFESMSYKVGD